MTVSDERLEAIRVEPRLLRSSPEDLSLLLIEAANAALEDFRARSLGDVPQFDLRKVVADIQKANEQFESGMRQVQSSAAETIAKLRQEGVRTGDLPSIDVQDLVGDLSEVLRTMSDAQNADDEELTGTGEAPRGAARAVCVTGGRLDSLTLDPARAMRGTVELERDVVTAVNAALDDLAAKTRERQAARIDTDAMKKQLGELRDRNLARMKSHFRALGDTAGGIEPQ